MIRTGVIDSLNLSSSDLESLFLSEDNYTIEPIKGIGVFKPERWKSAFKKPLTQNIIEAKILHTSTGLELPIKRYSIPKDKQTLEFAGLHGYNDKSNTLKELLQSLKGQIQDKSLTRLDIAIDFKEKIPIRVIKHIRKVRQKLFSWYNSTYFKTERENKKNYHINILLYDKGIKENLNDDVSRLEFSFGGSYFRGKYKIKDLPLLYAKMEKTIKRFTGLNIEIERL